MKIQGQEVATFHWHQDTPKDVVAVLNNGKTVKLNEKQFREFVKKYR